MALKKYKPVTPGQRFKVISAFDDITTNKPEKSLLCPKHRTGGRNNSGKMTVRYRGGGHKQMYRIIDFKRDKDGIPATVKTIEYDPNRSARNALLFYADGEKRYIVAPTASRSARKSSAASVSPPIWATACLSARSPSAPSSITSRCARDKAPRSPAAPALTPS